MVKMMKRYNVVAKRTLTLEELNKGFMDEYVRLVNQYYKEGKSVTPTEFYVYISEEGKLAKMIRFSTLEYKKFLKKGLSSVHLTKKKRSVYLGIEFDITSDDKKMNVGARDLVGFSYSY